VDWLAVITDNPEIFRLRKVLLELCLAQAPINTDSLVPLSKYFHALLSHQSLTSQPASIMIDVSMDDFVPLMNQLEPGIVIFDKDYKIHYINRVILTLFPDFSPEAIFSQSLPDLHQQESADKIKRMLDLLSTSKRQVPFSIKIFSKDNQYKYLFIKLISLLSPNLNAFLSCALLYNITMYISDKSTHLLKIPVGIKNEIRLINIENVIYVEADNVYSRVYTASGRFFSGLSLGVLYGRLPHKYFFRIHRSYIVNLTKINKVFKEPGTIYVSLQDAAERLPVSRSRSREFLERLGIK